MLLWLLLLLLVLPLLLLSLLPLLQRLLPLLLFTPVNNKREGSTPPKAPREEDAFSSIERENNDCVVPLLLLPGLLMTLCAAADASREECRRGRFVMATLSLSASFRCLWSSSLLFMTSWRTLPISAASGACRPLFTELDCPLGWSPPVEVPF
jgi:hypothetical protein